MDALDAVVVLLLAAGAAGAALILWNVPDYSRSRRWLLACLFLVMFVAIAAITIIARPR